MMVRYQGAQWCTQGRTKIARCKMGQKASDRWNEPRHCCPLPAPIFSVMIVRWSIVPPGVGERGISLIVCLFLCSHRVRAAELMSPTCYFEKFLPIQGCPKAVQVAHHVRDIECFRAFVCAQER